MVEDLCQKFPQLRSDEALQAFKRKWMYMFVYAEVGYARAYTSLNCWTFARPVCDIVMSHVTLVSLLTVDIGEHRHSVRLTYRVDLCLSDVPEEYDCDSALFCTSFFVVICCIYSMMHLNVTRFDLKWVSANVFK